MVSHLVRALLALCIIVHPLHSWACPEGTLGRELHHEEAAPVTGLPENVVQALAPWIEASEWARNGSLRRLPSEKKMYRVFVSDKVSTPEVLTSSGERTLVVPKNVTSQMLDEGGVAQVWLIGSERHPYGGKSSRVKTLRKIQAEGIEAGIQHFDGDQQSFLYVAPTGTGKSEVLFRILGHELKQPRSKGTINLVLAHQNEIVAQLEKGTRAVADPAGVKVTHAVSALDDPSPDGRVVVTTIQALSGWVARATPEQLEQLRMRLGMVVFDEAHHVGAATWLEAIRKILEDNDNTKFLGATATPVHRDAKIQSIFNDLFEGRSFWAYLDHKAEGVGVDREVGSVVDQLEHSIAVGELTPLEKLYAIDPNSFDKDGTSIFEKADPGNSRSDFRIKKEQYDPLAKRLTPLLKRHDSGFFAVNSIEEAESMARYFSQRFPDKKFEVYHGNLTGSQRASVEARMRAGEKIFLITVNLLDEGVDFPHMSLYVDLNRTLGVRQLLQRWGRVARLSPGKDSIEIATLTDWKDSDQIAEKVALLDSFASKGDLAFKPKSQKETEKPQIDPLGNLVDGAIVLNDAEHAQQLAKLREAARQIFAMQSKISPAERAAIYLEKTGMLPTPSVDTSAYQWCIKLVDQPVEQWPPMKPELNKALQDYSSVKRRSLTPSSIAYIEKTRKIPSQMDDKGVYWWARNLCKKDPSTWPEMSDEVRNILLEFKRTRITTGGNLQATIEFFRKNGRLPTKKEDDGSYVWYSRFVKTPPENWTKVPEDLKNALLELRSKLPPEPSAPRAPRALSNADLSIDYIQKLGRVPTSNENPRVYEWVRYLIKRDRSLWPEMPEDVASILIKHVESKGQAAPAPASELSGYERVVKRIEEGKGLPTAREDSQAYTWFIQILRRPEARWPEMPPKVREALQNYSKTKRIMGNPLARLTEFVLTGKGLPTPSQDDSAYKFYRKLIHEDPKSWPEMHPELRKTLLDYAQRNYSPPPKSAPTRPAVISLPSKTPPPPRPLLSEDPMKQATWAVLYGDGLPTITVNRLVFLWYHTLPDDPSLWPAEMKPQLKEAIVDYKTELAETKQEELAAKERSKAALKPHEAIKHEESKPILPPPPRASPPKPRPAAAPKPDYNLNTPIGRLTRAVKEDGGLPDRSESPTDFAWYHSLPDDASKWPANMDPDLRAAILEYKKELAETKKKRELAEQERLKASLQKTVEIKPAVQAPAVPQAPPVDLSTPLARVSHHVKKTGVLPTQLESRNDFLWYHQLPDNPDLWPKDMDPYVRELIIDYKAELAEKRKGGRR